MSLRIHPQAWISLSIVTASCLLGCSSSANNAGTPQPAAAPAAAPAQAAAPALAAKDEAAQIFGMRCTPCHGPQGRGDGPASGGLNPKPRNFTDATWQGAVSDEHIEQIIQYGGAAVQKSPAMPANPDLTSRPEVVAALRQHIRSLKQ